MKNGAIPVGMECKSGAEMRTAGYQILQGLVAANAFLVVHMHNG